MALNFEGAVIFLYCRVFFNSSPSQEAISYGRDILACGIYAHLH